MKYKKLNYVILFYLIFVCYNIAPVECAEYSKVDMTNTVTLTEKNLYATHKDTIYLKIFEGEVDFNKNFTMVEVTVVEINSTIPLEMTLSYMTCEEIGGHSISWPNSVYYNGELYTNITQGQEYYYAFVWVPGRNDSISPPHSLILYLKSIGGIFSGSITLTVHVVLTGKIYGLIPEDFFGFEWFFGLFLLPLGKIWRDKRSKKSN